LRILIAIDGSPHGERTLRFCAQIVRRAGELPIVLTVIDQQGDDSPTLADGVRTRARELLASSSVQVRVRTGQPAEEITQEAQEGNYDLVIVGRRPRRGLLARLLHNSTMMQVVERALCPVMVVQGKIGPIHHILLCDSGAGAEFTGQSLSYSERESALGHFTAKLAEQVIGEAGVTVLHVMSQMSAGPGVRGMQLRAGAEELIEDQTLEGELLERDVDLLDRPGIHPHPKVRHGLVVDEILAESKGGDYDLVVIGAHRDQGWQRVLLDDLARRIVLRLDRPVLVVR